jgi:hypothetical protein
MKYMSFKRLVVLVAVTALAALSAVAVALADNVQNDVSAVVGNDTITAGGSTTINYRITANNGDGQTGCNAADGSSAKVTINAPAGVTASPSSLTFTACGITNSQAVVFSSSTPGDYPITVSVSDSGAGTYNTNPANFTLHVNAPPPPSDSTAPVIQPTVTGTLGDNGWYTSDVKLTWSVTDPESAISSQTGCGETNITSDQQSVGYTCSATSAGGTSSETVSIKRDASAPALNCEAGPSGWQADNVLLGCNAADVGPSGLANSGDASFQLSTNVAAGSETSNAQTGSKTVKDSAGNSASIGPFSFMVDRKAPTVSCDSPAPSFLLNQSPANVTGAAADGGSGPASQNLSQPADTSSVGGGKTVTLTASDAVGNQGSATCSYSVSYKFDGFYAPVDNNGVLNAAKAGQAIPLKWRLLDANNNPVTSLSSVKVTVTNYNCSRATTEDALEEYAAGSSGLQNLGNGYYQFNWKSPTTYANSCKTLNLDLGEGSPHTALFEFKK